MFGDIVAFKENLLSWKETFDLKEQPSALLYRAFLDYLTERASDKYLQGLCSNFASSAKVLKGKRVLVVHPFVESIKYQYEYNREQLFTNPDVLPEFKELILIKAVQTQANAKDPRFNDWFEALQYMKDEIDKHEYDIALIGCGAYGTCLAAVSYTHLTLPTIA